MAQTRSQTTTHNGFAIPLQPDTDLGLAMLIAESEDGQHEPVAVVGTISEAWEAAESDLRDRMRRLELGEDAGICPTIYKVWARGIDGSYCVACEITDIV
jgi:hypothetical protein